LRPHAAFLRGASAAGLCGARPQRNAATEGRPWGALRWIWGGVPPRVCQGNLRLPATRLCFADHQSLAQPTPGCARDHSRCLLTRKGLFKAHITHRFPASITKPAMRPLTLQAAPRITVAYYNRITVPYGDRITVASCGRITVPYYSRITVP
jgi:hypothetical protein